MGTGAADSVGGPNEGSGTDPAPVPLMPAPTRWQMDPTTADEDGVVGVGADLDVSSLLGAYRQGIFPWPHKGMPLLWFSPDPRAVLTRELLHVSRNLRRTLLRSGWTTTIDRATSEVIRACADRDEGTWITPEMQDAYLALAALGWVHSLEVWSDADLVGGIYGVQIGGVFTGESMFHRRTDASKVALMDLCVRFAGCGGALLDVQIMTDHLRSLGAVEIARPDFLAALRVEERRSCQLDRERRPVSRLAAG